VCDWSGPEAHRLRVHVEPHIRATDRTRYRTSWRNAHMSWRFGLTLAVGASQRILCVCHRVSPLALAMELPGRTADHPKTRVDIRDVVPRRADAELWWSELRLHGAVSRPSPCPSPWGQSVPRQNAVLRARSIGPGLSYMRSRDSAMPVMYPFSLDGSSPPFPDPRRLSF
jgi:hypothetical protein